MRLLFLRIDFNRTWCIIQIAATFGIYRNPASNWIDTTTEEKNLGLTIVNIYV